MNGDTPHTTSDAADDDTRIEADIALYALTLIARGRKNGRPVTAETAQQIARETLTALDVSWQDAK